MSTVTALYDENYTGRIGDWCRRHGVAYIGHVIEENNAHARLGAGMGHFFRALWGQDMSGIDVVLHEIIPGLKGMTHAWTARDFEADEEFFYYGLAKLAASLAHIDPKKKGRALCEIFGAYGWQEGLKQMKWLTDFMLVRGINYYVPHAFTPKAFPDPDCPPHFYARGRNPQFRYFGLLMDYMNRMCHLFNGGIHQATAAILYHAEAEWSGKDYMLCQKPMRVLMENQIDADFFPVDVLTGPLVRIRNGELCCNGETYKTLIIPYTEALPIKLLAFLRQARKEGLPVYFVNGLPVRICEGYSEECLQEMEGFPVVPLEELADVLVKQGFFDVSVSRKQPDLRIFHYRQEEADYYLLFNESIHQEIQTEIQFRDKRQALAYDAVLNRTFSVHGRVGAERTAIPVRLMPYETCVLVFGNEKELLKSSAPFTGKINGSRSPILGKWKVALADSLEYPHFKTCPEIKDIGNLNTPEGLPRFTGTIRYETDFTWTFDKQRSILDLGEVGEIAQVWLNGADNIRIGKYLTCL